MRRFFTLLSLLAVQVFTASSLLAQEAETVEASGFQVLKKQFIDGDWRFMAIVLVCLILGLAFCIERIITLNLASANTTKLLGRIDDRLAEGDVEGAKEVAR